MPSRDEILKFLGESQDAAGKREIAKHFRLKGAEKIALKALLKDMADEGLIDSDKGRAFHKMGGLPKVTVLKVIEADGRDLIAIPDNWQAEGVPMPRVRLSERGRSALAVGDRVLARTEEAGSGYRAFVMKKLQRASEQLLGVVEKGEGRKLWLKPVDKRIRRMVPISDPCNAEPGQLVLAEQHGQRDRISAKVTEVLGEPFAPRSFSLIAIHKYGIPHDFPSDAIDEAERAAKLPLSADHREDLRHIPIVAIDPVDARDHDDAIWATPDDDPANAGGYRAIVAIADVSYYVRPGGAIDRAARKRGNSVYFPDRVVPMLPEILSADMCSLKAGQDRAAMVCHLVIDASGKLRNWRFTRALVRLAANIAYEDAQAAIDGAKPHDLQDTVLKPLWACWKLLFMAREAREPLDLDLPERRIVLDEAGRIVSVAVRERLDAHRLVEDFMIAANVAAAKALEAKKAPVVYRVHEPPSREKLVALKDYLATFDISFALGQVVRPATFNGILARVTDDTVKPLVMEQVLRSQTQAYYGPRNMGHFGLSLASYGHFTSPIRRYADLLLHRALVDAHGLEQPPAPKLDLPPTTGLAEHDAASLDRICELISGFERRAMEAERETVDRYVAAFLATKVGEIHKVRITGVQSFGFFATIEEFGGDGLVPVSTLGAERFWYDEASQTLTGESSGERYAVGQRLELRLAEADPVTGAIKFELPEGGNYMPGPPPRSKGPGNRPGGRPPIKRRGRPANIRHQSR
ncbi:ribonuclease R [Sphingomonas ursincola]|uniref:ribonuclease R n=1 Tax=Blastomonas TaxID=150203 RepID=UPI000AF27C9B|nr:ribonuclease R [Sphingomonas ursincola]MBY0620561.1 ribonuclease R [Sphingomonas ursincola]MCH2239270.1 ribonuclease R [Blastomonas sp.]